MSFGTITGYCAHCGEEPDFEMNFHPVCGCVVCEACERFDRCPVKEAEAKRFATIATTIKTEWKARLEDLRAKELATVEQAGRICDHGARAFHRAELLTELIADEAFGLEKLLPHIFSVDKRKAAA